MQAETLTWESLAKAAQNPNDYSDLPDEESLMRNCDRNAGRRSWKLYEIIDCLNVIGD